MNVLYFEEWALGQFEKIVLIDFFFLEKEKNVARGGVEEKRRFVVPFIYTLIGCFLYVPWLGIESITLVYWDNALTNGATQSDTSAILKWRFDL